MWEAIIKKPTLITINKRRHASKSIHRARKKGIQYRSYISSKSNKRRRRYIGTVETK
jgi:hypothetical protein